VVDRRLDRHNEDLASRAKLIPGLNARLVLIDPDTNTDKYYVLQGLEDDNGCYSYQRWGRTGTDGEAKIQGPMEREEVEKILAKVFKDKSGKEWGSITPGDRGLPGKYWLQREFNASETAKWQYYVHDNIDGKRNDWYDYSGKASEEVEEIFAQHKANACESRTATRVVASGNLGFSYLVDLEAMTQTNMKTRKQRKIRRVTGAQALSRQSSGSHMMKMMMKKRMMPMVMKRLSSVMKSAKKPMKKVMKKLMKKKPMKKVMKKAMKKVSKIAKGKRGKWLVFSGRKEKTSKGLKAADFVKNKYNRVVSKKKSALQKRNAWMIATVKARASLRITGFCPCGGATEKGKAVYEKAKSFYHQTL